jgi:hypothetical protein
MMVMANILKLTGLAAALFLAALLLPAATAQQTEPPQDTEKAAGTDMPAATPAGSTTAAATARDTDSAEAASGESSPFEYEATEQISEDLSVSFPVDI